MTVERGLELALTLLGAHLLATLVFVGWLARPAPPRARLVFDPPSEAEHHGEHARGPAQPPKGRFEDEAEATQGYVDQLARAFDLEVLASEELEVEALREALLAARACETLDCPGVRDLVDQAVRTGRPVPPLPAWGGDPEALAVSQYLHAIRGEVRRAAREAERPELVPDEELFEAAGGCERFDCEDLELLLEEVGVAMSAMGRSVPPRPSLEEPG